MVLKLDSLNFIEANVIVKGNDLHLNIKRQLNHCKPVIIPIKGEEWGVRCSSYLQISPSSSTLYLIGANKGNTCYLNLNTHEKAVHYGEIIRDLLKATNALFREGNLELYGDGPFVY